MEKLHIADIAAMLDLPIPPSGQSSYYVSCPCCDEDPRKKHLNINLVKDVFRCPRCGVSGGMFDLYSLYTGIPRDKVYNTLVERLDSPVVLEQIKRRAPMQLPNVQEYPLTDIEARNATYSALLSRLTLAQDHRENLRGRGLTDEDIERCGYKSTPVFGMEMIAKKLQAEGLYLSGVPGFHRTEQDAWTFVSDCRGILIPVRDIQGRIQGLQIRRDNVKKRKFRWFSSTDRKDGCRAESWTHLAGAIRNKVLLTEGPMKADVIHALTGITVLAVPGVNPLAQLQKTVEQMQAEGLREIKTAFDMDLRTNLHVREAYQKLLELLKAMGFRYGTYLWDERYKGLDDYLWEKVKSKTKEYRN